MKPTNPLVNFTPLEDLSDSQKKDVQKYHERHGIRMERFAVFPREKIERLLHEPLADDAAPLYQELILSEQADLTETLESHYDLFRRIANLERPLSTQERQEYLDSLLAIYRRMSETGCGPDRFLDDEGTLFVAPEREGRILAEQMGWNPAGRFKTPDAKRIPNGDDGLIVGLNDLDLQGGSFQRAILVDGAVASGATLIAVMKSLRVQEIREFHIYCIHTTRQALNAMKSYSARHGLDIRVVTGKATTGLSSKYYANYWDEREGRMRYEVGDLGDTIAPLFENRKPD